MAHTTLIVGFGKAGRALHLPAVLHARRLCRGEGLFAERRLMAIDPRLSIEPRRREDDTLSLFRSLAQALPELDPAATVVHVCTPPGSRPAVLDELARAGLRKLICEKPVATTLAHLREIRELVDEHELELSVASPWLFSSLTSRLRKLVGSGRLGALRSIAIVQSKPRFARTLDDADHPSAFEVELPHSVGVALYLAGSDARVLAASHAPMVVDDRAIATFGGVTVELAQRGGVRTRIHSDLTAPVRQRSIELRFEHGVALGHYPVSGDDRFAQLTITAGIDGSAASDGWAGTGGPATISAGLAADHEVFPDEHLTRMMIACYSSFEQAGPRPVSDLAFNVRVMEAIAHAKQLAGVADPAQIVAEPPLSVPVR